MVQGIETQGHHSIAVLFLILGFFLLSGCVSTPNVPVAKYDKAPELIYPGISLFYKTPSDDLKRNCSQFDQKSVLHHCTLNQFEHDSLIQQFKNTNLFHQVQSYSEDTDYQFYITTASYNHEGADELSQAALAGATLLLVPIKVSGNITTEITVAWKGQLLKTYTYDLPFSDSASLFSPAGKGKDKFAETLVSYFLKEAQEDQIFSPEFVARKLGASDYGTNLEYPPEIADFQFKSMSSFHHPLDGVQLHYSGKLFKFDEVTIHIYPIRSPEWKDSEKQLTQEANNFLKDVEISVLEGINKSAEFQEPISIANTTTGLKITGTITNQAGEKLASSAYFFTQNDKIIKIVSHIIVTENLPDLDAFATTAIATIKTPEESLFMAKLRQHYRKNEFGVN